MDDARSYAGPLPHTFDYERETGKMVVTKGLRKAWDPEPVAVDVREATLFARAPFAGVDVWLARVERRKMAPLAPSS
jgi:hypothetical protein